MTNSDIIIELHIPDFQKAEQFYKILGFTVVRREETHGGYMVMQKQNCTIAFYGGVLKEYNHSYFGKFPSDSKKGYAVEILLFVDHIEKFYNQVKGQVNVVAELKQKPWGVQDFRIEDPFGFYIRVSQRYDIAATKED